MDETQRRRRAVMEVVERHLKLDQLVTRYLRGREDPPDTPDPLEGTDPFEYPDHVVINRRG